MCLYCPLTKLASSFIGSQNWWWLHLLWLESLITISINFLFLHFLHFIYSQFSVDSVFYLCSLADNSLPILRCIKVLSILMRHRNLLNCPSEIRGYRSNGELQPMPQRVVLTFGCWYSSKSSFLVNWCNFVFQLRYCTWSPANLLYAFVEVFHYKFICLHLSLSYWCSVGFSCNECFFTFA